MYWAVREAVVIGMMPPGPRNINNCQEWVNSRVLVLTAAWGGDRSPDGLNDPLTQNPRPLWSNKQLTGIKLGTLKRIQYWQEETQHPIGAGPSNHDTQGPTDPGLPPRK